MTAYAGPYSVRGKVKVACTTHGNEYEAHGDFVFPPGDLFIAKKITVINGNLKILKGAHVLCHVFEFKGHTPGTIIEEGTFERIPELPQFIKRQKELEVPFLVPSLNALKFPDDFPESSEVTVLRSARDLNLTRMVS